MTETRTDFRSGAAYNAALVDGPSAQELHAIDKMAEFLGVVPSASTLDLLDLRTNPRHAAMQAMSTSYPSSDWLTAPLAHAGRTRTGPGGAPRPGPCTTRSARRRTRLGQRPVGSGSNSGAT